MDIVSELLEVFFHSKYGYSTFEQDMEWMIKITLIISPGRNCKSQPSLKLIIVTKLGKFDNGIVI